MMKRATLLAVTIFFIINYSTSAVPGEQKEPVPVAAHFVAVKAFNDWLELEGRVTGRHKPSVAVIMLDAHTVEAQVIKPGQSVRVFLPKPRTGRLKGSVREVIPAKGGEFSYKIKVYAENPAQALSPDQGVKAEIRVVSSPNNPYVPKACLVREDDRTYLFVIEPQEEGHRAFRRQVRSGVETGRWVEIRDGLAPAQLVALPPFEGLQSGARVMITKIEKDQLND